MLTSSCFFFPIICIIIQFFNDRLLLAMIGATVASVVFGLTLGDNDYDVLQNTLEELNRVKESEATSRHDAESANKVKTIFLENISNELLDPIKEVNDISNEIEGMTEDIELKKYAKEINNASVELLNVVEDIMKVAKNK